MNETKHRGKPRVKTYVYQEDGEELVFNSLSDAEKDSSIPKKNYQKKLFKKCSMKEERKPIKN